MRLAAAYTVHIDPTAGGSFKCSKCVAGLESASFYRCNVCNFNVCIRCAMQDDAPSPPAAQLIDRTTSDGEVARGTEHERGGVYSEGASMSEAKNADKRQLYSVDDDVRPPTSLSPGMPEVQAMTVGSSGGTMTAAGGAQSHALSMASL